MPEDDPQDRAFATRPVDADDERFLERLYGTTREPELALTTFSDEEKRQFVRQQFEAQRTHYETHFPDADHRIVLREGEAVGQIWIDRREKEVRVLDMSLLPEHRNLGIGSELLAYYQAEAVSRDLPLTLCVERNNPQARRFYLRLGFSVIEDLDTHEFLEWVPPA